MLHFRGHTKAGKKQAWMFSKLSFSKYVVLPENFSICNILFAKIDLWIKVFSFESLMCISFQNVIHLPWRRILQTYPTLFSYRWKDGMSLKTHFLHCLFEGKKQKNASLFCKKNNVLLLWRKEQSYAAKKKNFCWKVIMYLRSVLPIFWRVQFFAGALFSSTTVLYKKLCVCSLLHHFFHFIWSTFKLEST